MPDSSREIGTQRERTPRLNLHVPEEAMADEGAYYDGIGAELKSERMRWNLTLAEVSSRLRIRQAHLEAIEAGRFGDLPGRIYAIGFVRSYAEFLGADGDVSVSLFKAEFGPGGHSRKLVFPVPPDENRRPGLKTLLASAVLAALVYGGWYVWQGEERSAVELVPEVPKRMLEQAALPEQQAPATSSGLGVANAAESSQSQEDAPVSQSEPEVRSIDLAVVGRERETPEPSAAQAPASPAGETGTAGSQRSAASAQDESAGAAGNDAAATANQEEGSGTTGADTAIETGSATDATAATPDATDAASASQAADQTVQSLPPETRPAAPSGSEAAASRADEEVQVAAVMPPPVPEVEPGNDAAPRVLGIANQNARVLVRATGPVQVIVKGLDGSTVMPHRVLQSGDIYRAPNGGKVVLEADRTENLQIIVDGRLIGRVDSLTEPGVGLSLNPDMLKALAN